MLEVGQLQVEITRWLLVWQSQNYKNKFSHRVRSVGRLYKITPVSKHLQWILMCFKCRYHRDKSVRDWFQELAAVCRTMVLREAMY
ncbi:hypothetical protein TNCV_764591 [Trichonephila clavipes]|nr:hypothetical protein TNCV_764591 [Trichonephila clavipes]